jgi:hypothetical protein
VVQEEGMGRQLSFTFNTSSEFATGYSHYKEWYFIDNNLLC